MAVKQDRRNGHWMYRFMNQGMDYCESGFRTWKQADDAQTKKKNDLINARVNPKLVGQAMTWADACDWWGETIVPKKRSGKTDLGRLSLIKAEMGFRQINATTPEEVEDFLDRLPTLRQTRLQNGREIKCRSVGQHTRNHYLALLKAIVNRLKHKRKYFGDNPALYVDMIQVPKARVRFLYPDEEEILSPVILRYPKVYPYYVTAMHTGARCEEMINLKKRHLDFTINNIFIERAKSNQGSKSRYIPMSDEIRPFLKQICDRLAPEDFLFYQYTPKRLSWNFSKICDRARIPDFTLHCCRHTFAARMLGRGEHLYIVSNILGHSSQKVTQDHYGHLAFQDLQKAIKSIEGVIRHMGNSFATDLQQGSQKVAPVCD